jgi:transcriptional accessory protein Tex/SPT6
MRADIGTKRLLPDVVFENCIGYFRFPMTEDAGEPLDATAIHPEYYQVARTVAASALDMATNDENAIEEIMKPDNTPKLNTLDLKAYAESLNDPSLQLMFEFIVEELKNPFSVKTKSFEEMSALDVLYKTSGESFASLRKGSIVNAQVVNTSHD